MREIVSVTVECARSLMMLRGPALVPVGYTSHVARQRLSYVILVSVLTVVFVPLAEALVRPGFQYNSFQYPVATIGMTVVSVMALRSLRQKWQMLERQGAYAAFDQHFYRLLLAVTLSSLCVSLTLGSVNRSVTHAYIVTLFLFASCGLSVFSWREKIKHQRSKS